MSDQLPPVPPDPAFPPVPPVPQVPPVPPTPVMAPAGDKKGLAIASLVLGILSLCASLAWFCGAPTSIAGIILGILGMKSTDKGMAIAGIVLSAIGVLLTIVFGILGMVSGPIINNIFNQIQTQLVPSGY